MRMLATGTILLTLGALSAWAGKDEEERLKEAATTVSEMATADDKGIPKDLLGKAVCTVVVPGVKKAGFIVGGKYGRGFASCRDGKGGWSAPAAMRIEGGSVGFQIGGAESDVIILVMNKTGMEKLLQSKFTLGGEGTAAIGPVGRDAEAMTDAQMRAEMLSWSRSRGAFAGISLQGATLRQDDDANKGLYGSALDNKAILSGGTPAPPAAAPFLSALQKFSPKKTS